MKLTDKQHNADRLGLFSRDDSILNLLDRAARFAQSDISILITGESGTGKEVLARAMHAMSPRAKYPFGVVNVAALPEALIESSLFGAERGSFTGANTAKTGLIEAAVGGTFFFDEIGDFPLPLQVKLLRVIQERKVMRVGANQERSVDVRFVFATHRPLLELVKANLFREDLFYRVNEIELPLPALRERGNDRVFLAEHFAHKVGMDVLGKALTLTPECLSMVGSYDWPGNVRELYSAIKRAVILCDGESIDVTDLQIANKAARSSQVDAQEKIHTSDLKESIPFDATDATDATEVADEHFSWDSESLNRARIEAEVKVVLACLKEQGGNVSSVAKLLNISRPTVYSILRKAKEWVSA
jgi:two-component system, NtrC family, response regulator